MSFWNTIGSAWNIIWPILVAILLFGVVIFVHEFGHFLFAKLFKVRVNEFAMGFGKTLFKFQKGETTYALRLLPFGGFCAMEGEDGESDCENSFGRKKVWQKIIIVAAGAVFNLILGFFLMMLIVSLMGRIPSTTISKFDKTATSSSYGLQAGDTIKSINGGAVFTSDDIGFLLMRDRDGIVDMTVERNGSSVNLNQVGFQMESVEGHSYVKLDFFVEPLKKDFGTTVSQGVLRSFSMTRMVWGSLVDLVTGRYGINDISGPVGVTQIVSEAVTSVGTDGLQGFLYLLNIICLITINLGIFNLLPIPALDGSRIVFLVIEGIRRKPIPPKKEAWVHAAGLIVLMAFMVFICFKDLWQWIT